MNVLIIKLQGSKRAVGEGGEPFSDIILTIPALEMTLISLIQPLPYPPWHIPAAEKNAP